LSEEIAGWWDWGVRFINYADFGDHYGAEVYYHMAHRNLRIRVSLHGIRSAEDTTGEEFLAIIDDLSLGLVEAVTAHLPCRTSPDTAPGPVCH